MEKPAAPPRLNPRTVERNHPPRTCEQCGKEFVPNHGRTRICSDECRERRAMNRKNGINMTFRRTELKTDATDVQQEIKTQELAEKFAPSHTRRDPMSNPQAAPRIKLKPVQRLPALGGYAAVGSPEAQAAIARVRAEAESG